MSTPQVLITKARIAAFLARIKTNKATCPLPFPTLDPNIPTTIRYQRMGGREQRT